MQETHIYDYRIDEKSNNKGNLVVDLVGHKKKVLELGAGPGSIARVLKNINHCSVSAIEIDKSAIGLLSEYCENIYQYDLNDQEWADLLNEKFDVVIAADVLEHLNNPALTLESIKKVLLEDGYAVFSLPHIAHNAAMASILQERFEYKDCGLLDKTHLRFFGIHDMQQLLNNAGYRIDDAKFFVQNPYETEFADRWSTLPNYLKKALQKQKWGSVYQVIIKATPTINGQGITLQNVIIPKIKSDLAVLEEKKGLFFKNNTERFIFYYKKTKLDTETYFFNKKITRPFVILLRYFVYFIKNISRHE